MHPETALRDAILEFIQERDPALALIDVDPHPFIRDLGMAAEFLGQRVIMRGEEADAAHVGGYVM